MFADRMTASDWNRLIANPIVLSDKKNAPLAIWGSIVARPEIDQSSGYPRCIKENIDEIYALPVDVDNGTTMEEFERDFHRYSYQLYTTYSWHNGKPGDRFRVFFPLKEPINVKWLVPPVKKILMSLFDMADKTCFDRGHWQCLPCVSSKDAPYRYVQHKGEQLSFASENFERLYTEYTEDFHWKRAIAEADRDPTANHQGALKHVQTVFDNTNEGSRDTTVYAKIMWLKETVGCTYSEIISLRPPVGFDNDYIAKVNRIFSGQ
jgi:hypothetical protein